MHRARTATELLDVGFHVLRACWSPILKISLGFASPVLLLWLLAPESSWRQVESLANFLYVPAYAAIVVVTAQYVRREELSARRALQPVGEHFFRLWGMSLLQALLVVLGLLLLVVPGVLALIWTFAGSAVILLEGRGVFEALSRSRALVRGHAKHVLATLVLAYGLVLAGALGAAVGLASVQGVFGLSERWFNFTFELWSVVVLPYAAIVTSLLYFDLRVRTEALDLEDAVAALDGGALGAVRPSATELSPHRPRTDPLQEVHHA